MKYFLMAMIASLTLVGCDSTEDVPPTDHTIAIEDLSSTFAELYCSRAFNCCDSTELTDLGYATEEACVSAEILSFEEDVMADAEAGIAAGTVVYDASAAGFCQVAMEAMNCSLGLDEGFEDPSCDGVFSGNVAIDSACFSYLECAADDSWCGNDDVCVTTPALVAEDGACSYESQLVCDVDLYCNDSDICTALPGDGETCYFNMCASGFACDTSDVCGDLLLNGTACTTPGMCLSGYCDYWDTYLCTDAPAPFCDGI